MQLQLQLQRMQQQMQQPQNMQNMQQQMQQLQQMQQMQQMQMQQMRETAQAQQQQQQPAAPAPAAPSSPPQEQQISAVAVAQPEREPTPPQPVSGSAAGGSAVASGHSSQPIAQCTSSPSKKRNRTSGDDVQADDVSAPSPPPENAKRLKADPETHPSSSPVSVTSPTLSEGGKSPAVA